VRKTAVFLRMEKGAEGENRGRPVRKTRANRKIGAHRGKSKTASGIEQEPAGRLWRNPDEHRHVDRGAAPKGGDAKSGKRKNRGQSPPKLVGGIGGE